jgi:hypothetical protein
MQRSPARTPNSSTTYRFLGGETPDKPQIPDKGSPRTNDSILRRPYYLPGATQGIDGSSVQSVTPRSSFSGTLSKSQTDRIGTQIYNIHSRRSEDLSSRSSPSGSASGVARTGPESPGTAKAPTVDRGRAESDRLLLQRRLESSQRSSVPDKVRPGVPAKSQTPRSSGGVGGPSSSDTKARGEDSVQLRSRIAQRRTQTTSHSGMGRGAGVEQVRVAGSEFRGRGTLDAKLREYGGRHGGKAETTRSYRDAFSQRSPVIYHDRPDLIRHSPRYTYLYRDGHHRLTSRLIWPGFEYPVCYSFGPSFVVRWVYPYYFRKSVFVSLGGYWPWDYDYLRYYWYGWHPYIWYGYYPIPQEIETPSYNYYTYNYYYSDGYSSSEASPDTSSYGMDSETRARLEAALEQQKAAKPPIETAADARFEEGVESFEAGKYDTAVTAFADAMALAPDDTILPYACAQALFAARRYTEAAQSLRDALRNVSPEKEGVFYPRGLYANDDALFAQIEQLLDRVEDFGFDADLRLLLGYQLLGIGETEYARQPIEQAGQDEVNAKAAGVLLDLLDKMEQGGTSSATEGQTSSAESDAARASLLEKAKGLSSKTEQPAGAANQKSQDMNDSNAISPDNGATIHSEPNDASNDLNGPEQGGWIKATPAAEQSPPVDEAGLLDPVGPAGRSVSVTDKEFAAVAGMLLLACAGLCLRRAERLGQSGPVQSSVEIHKEGSRRMEDI